MIKPAIFLSLAISALAGLYLVVDSNSHQPPVSPETFFSETRTTSPPSMGSGIGTAEALQTLWENVATAALTASDLPVIRDEITGAKLLRIDAHQINSVVKGDRITIAVPQLHQSLHVLVDSVNRSKFGTRSIHGHVAGDELLGFVLTSSSKAVYATIGTRDGVFNLFGNPDYAWIVPAAELNQHVDSEQPDYLLPNKSANQVEAE